MTLLLLFKSSGGGGAASGTAFESFVGGGMYLGRWEIDDYLTFAAQTHDSTGAAAAADAPPTYAIYEDETAGALVTGSMAALGAVTGLYTERVQLTAAAGFENGKAYTVRVEATVGGIVAAKADQFCLGGVTIRSSTGKNTLDSLTDAPDVSANVTAIKAVTDKLNTALELDGAVYRLTENALEEGPGGSATVAISAAQAASVASGQVAIRAHHSFTQTITSTSTDDLSAGELIFAAKIDADDDDDAAILLLSKGEGLTILDGAAHGTPAQGSIAVTGSAGAWEITLTLAYAVTSLLSDRAGAPLPSELKHVNGTSAKPVWTGNTVITKGVVKGVLA